MRALRVAMSTVMVCALAGCHDDWEEVYAQCVRDGRCGGGSGDDAGAVDAGPMPSLSFSGSIDFGASGRDAVAEQVVTLSNSTSTAATNLVLGFLGDTTSFEVVSETCGGIVAANGSCQVRVRLKATAPGSYSSTLRASVSNAASATTSVTASRVGPALVFSTSGTIDFGAASTGSFTEVSISVRNDGLTCAEPLLASFSTAIFTVSSLGGCAGPLDAGTSCTLTARFTPDNAQVFNDTLTVSAANSASVSNAVTGVGFLQGELVLQPTAWDAGELVVGASASTGFTLSNAGTAPTGPLAFQGVSAPFELSFDGGCAPGTQLPASGSCTFDVRYAPTSPGATALSLLVTSTDAGSAAAALSGRAYELVHITLQSDAGDGVGVVRAVEPGATHDCGGDCGFDVPRGTSIVATAMEVGGTSVFLDWEGGTCAGSDAGCGFVASADAGHLLVGRFSALWPLSVKVTGGAVVSDDGKIRCPGACTAAYPTGAVVRLRASEEPSVRVLGVLDQLAGCSSYPLGACDVVMTSPRAVDAGFTRANVAFVTAGAYPSNLGSAAAYDTICKNVARDAGLFEAPNDGGTWVAWRSDLGSGASFRLGTAGGWVRVDGRVVSPLAPLSDQNAPVVLDERNQLVDGGAIVVLTGTSTSGTVGASNCGGWVWDTGNSSVAGYVGRIDVAGWSSGVAPSATCMPTRVLCFEANRQRTLLVPAQRLEGPRAFVSVGVVDGGVTPAEANALCDAEAQDAGLSGSFVALRSTADAGASMLVTGDTWYRTDGQPLILPSTAGAVMRGQAPLLVPLNRTARGDVVAPFSRVWTGSDVPDLGGPANCSSWQGGVGSGTTGFANDAVNWWKATGAVANQPCASAYAVYCFQQ